MKNVDALIRGVFRRRLGLKRFGVRIEERRWQREIDALDRECELLRKRIDRRQFERL
jgi:hypothetical protein